MKILPAQTHPFSNAFLFIFMNFKYRRLIYFFFIPFSLLNQRTKKKKIGTLPSSTKFMVKSMKIGKLMDFVKFR